jgi:glycine dehydrogenase subunit 1
MHQSHRFLPTTEQDRQTLLAACGVSCIEELLAGIPSEVRFSGKLQIGDPLSEMEIKQKIQKLMQESRFQKNGLSFLGAGVYDHFCPAAVNQLTLRGEFLTSYTPYQAEMAQGTLKALFEFQTMIAEIFGMEVATGSHYDGATSFAESALMALRLQPEKQTLVVSKGLHPEYINVLETYTKNSHARIEYIPLDKTGKTDATALQKHLNHDTAAVFVQSPNFLGCIEDLEKISETTKQNKSLFCVNVTEPLSLAALNSPGFYGADMATGEGQSFGLPQSFGGPYLGLFTSKKEYVRQIPGRLCGETKDAKGRTSYVLTLSTREQHIRREKATSNICTNQNLCALWATIWLALVGKQGFIDLAHHNISKTEYLKEELQKTGKVKLRYPHTKTFNEFVMDISSSSSEFISKCVGHGVAPGLSLNHFYPADKSGILIATTEKKTKDDLDFLVDLVKKYG